MYKKYFLYFLPIILTGLIFTSSCKKEDKNNEIPFRSIVAGGPSGAAGTCGDSTILGVITNNLTLKSCKTYKLDGLVYVSNNATLTIEAGTVIKGIKGIPGTGGSPGTPGGSLIVTQGAKVIAIGTATDPIIFTSNEAAPTPGDFGGIVLIGKAPNNSATEIRPGGMPGTPMADVTYGGPSNNSPADNSGILKYVRIEYAGYEQLTDDELNGLSLCGVGNGTTLDYIEVYKCKDDAFSFFGGTVNASHLLAIDALDDMFSTSRGYSGTISYALGVADVNHADKSQSNGFESDNDALGSHTTPYTHPTYNNITIVGLPNATTASVTNSAPSGSGKYGRAAHLRKNAEFSINRSIFMGFNYGISLDSALPALGGNTYSKYLTGTSTLNSNRVHAYIMAYDKEYNTSAYTSIVPLGTTNAGIVGSDPNLNIKLGAPFSTTRVIGNYIPQVLSPVKSIGAFPIGNTTWANGWIIL